MKTDKPKFIVKREVKHLNGVLESDKIIVKIWEKRYIGEEGDYRYHFGYNTKDVAELITHLVEASQEKYDNNQD